MTKAGIVAVAVTATLAVLGAAPAHAQSTGERSAPAASASMSGRSCESLAFARASPAKITSAELVAAGAFKAPNGGRGAALYAQLPAFCRVAATLTPAKDSHIQMESGCPRRTGTEVPRGRQRRMGGHDLARCGGDRRCGVDMRPHRTTPVTPTLARSSRSSGQVDRLRVSRDARDDGAVERRSSARSTTVRHASRTTRAARLVGGRG